ncbi:MAG: hypothetical protein ACO3AF_06170 [Flavobacteriales bacterium]
MGKFKNYAFLALLGTIIAACGPDRFQIVVPFENEIVIPGNYKNGEFMVNVDTVDMEYLRDYLVNYGMTFDNIDKVSMDSAFVEMVSPDTTLWPFKKYEIFFVSRSEPGKQVLVAYKHNPTGAAGGFGNDLANRGNIEELAVNYGDIQPWLTDTFITRFDTRMVTVTDNSQQEYRLKIKYSIRVEAMK